MQGREFGFSRLLLLIGGLFGVWAFFKPFYQIEAFYARPSGFDIGKELFYYFQHQPIDGFINHLFLQELTQSLTYYIPTFILLIIPLVFGFVALELLIRAFWLRLNVVHRVWLFLTLSFIGIIAGYWLGQQQDDFELYFFEAVRSGYWKSLTMIVFGLLAKYVD